YTTLFRSSGTWSSWMCAPTSRATTAARSRDRSCHARGVRLRVTLLPLNGSGWFGRDVIDNTVDVWDLVHNAAGKPGEEVIRHARPVSGHGILPAHQSH